MSNKTDTLSAADKIGKDSPYHTYQNAVDCAATVDNTFQLLKIWGSET